MNALQMILKWMVFSMCVWQEVKAVLSQTPNITSVNISNEICVKHFNRGIQKCMEPFITVSDSYTEAKLQDMDSKKILLKHLCFEYEKMLQCLHSSLANCPTLKNMRKVQAKLGTSWVKTVNRLCIIQSNVNKTDTNQTEDTGMIHKENLHVSRPGHTETDKHFMDNAIHNKLPEKKKRIHYWQNIQKEKQSRMFKGKFRYTYNRVEVDTYSVMKHRRHRTGALTVTDKPSSSSSLIINTLLTLTGLVMLYFNEMFLY